MRDERRLDTLVVATRPASVIFLSPNFSSNERILSLIDSRSAKTFGDNVPAFEIARARARSCASEIRVLGNYLERVGRFLE